MRQNKYNAIKTTVDNITFHSKREAARYQELMLLQRAGLITDLKLQVSFIIIVNGKKICEYIADFQYVDTTTGKTVIEDSKGFRNQVYIIKKKLVEAQFGVQIVEV